MSGIAVFFYFIQWLGETAPAAYHKMKIKFYSLYKKEIETFVNIGVLRIFATKTINNWRNSCIKIY